MLHVEAGVYVRVSEVSGERAPQPRPLANGFSPSKAYRLLGIHSPSETSEAYLIVSNDRDEMWFISNRHFRVVGVFPSKRQLSFDLDRASVSPMPRAIGEHPVTQSNANGHGADPQPLKTIPLRSAN